MIEAIIAFSGIIIGFTFSLVLMRIQNSRDNKKEEKRYLIKQYENMFEILLSIGFDKPTFKNFKTLLTTIHSKFLAVAHNITLYIDKDKLNLNTEEIIEFSNNYDPTLNKDEVNEYNLKYYDKIKEEIFNNIKILKEIIKKM